MPKRVLCIGAGASYGAREGGICPPLGTELLGFLRRNVPALKGLIWKSQLVHCGALLDGAEQTLNKYPNEQNFEKLLPQLEPRQRADLHSLIAILFSDLRLFGVAFDFGFGIFPTGDGYDRLITRLNVNAEEWVIVSLNYDVLFEQALLRCGLQFRYGHFEFADGTKASGNDLLVLKPHGSISFFAQADHVVSYGGTSSEIPRATGISARDDGSHAINFPIVYACGPDPAEIVPRIAPPGLQHLVMANYAPKKDSDINEENLTLVRKEAASLANGKSELVMIGVNPILDANDDPFVAEFLRGRFEKVTYVSRDEKAGAALRSLFPPAELHLDGLTEFLRGL